jgi:hypothetical protein
LSVYIRALVGIAYLGAVVMCVLRGFDFAGSIRPEWVLGLILLTVPWSLISVLFIWSLIHGAGLGFFSVMYGSFAVVNALLILRIGRRLKGATR